jgi:DNA-binding NarL/FixJ family response regulator
MPAGGRTILSDRELKPMGRQRPVSGDEPQVVSESRGGKPAGILIVEDDALLASHIKDVLGAAGYLVSGIASCGPEALSLAAAAPPQLALVDIRLPGAMDGVELALALRERLGVAIIFLTGAADAATVERARAVAPAGFLAKPFRPSQMFNAVEHVLKSLG